MTWMRCPSRPPLGGRLFFCLLSAVVALAAAPAAHAAAPPSWGSFAHAVGNSWTAQQMGNGTFRDYVYGGRVSFCAKRHCAPGLGNARYGESVLGYSLIQTGLRTGDSGMVNSGLRAIDYIVGRADLQRKLPTNFESMAVAGAYNVARHKLAKRPLFARHRAQWVRWLKRVKPQWIGSDRPYFNHTLVEAISNLELFRTGLRSNVRGAVLSRRQRPRLARLTRRVLNSEIPKVAAPTLRTSHGVRGEVLSDRPDFPIAYHGFSLGLYARAVDLMGRSAAPRTKLLLRRLSNASWLMAGPDGDVAYTGRSQEDVWALSATAFGTEYAAHLPGTRAAEAARFEAVANRAIARMDDAYGIGPKGLWIVPALTVDPVGGLRGIDSYAGGAAFSGLALMQLEWAIGAGHAGRSPGGLAADSDGSAGVMRGDNSTVMVRHGDLWYAVRQASSYARHASDLRWDFGLVAVKRLIGGHWRDVQPLRPTTSGPKATSAGPLLILKTAAGSGIPQGTSLKVGPSRVTTVTGGFREPGKNGRWLRRGVRFSYEPTACGVQLSFPARKGDKIEYSAFMRGSKGDVSIAGRSVSDAGQVVSFDHPAHVTLESGYASGADPALVRARLRFSAPAAETIAVQVCSR
jgi:hypothetical protein